MSTPNATVSSGTTTTPPPSPVSAPRNPASSAPMPSRAVNSSVFTDAVLHPLQLQLCVQLGVPLAKESLLRRWPLRAVLEGDQQEAGVGAEKIDDAAMLSCGHPQHVAAMKKRDMLAGKIDIEIGIGQRNEERIHLGCGVDVIACTGHFVEIDADFIGFETGNRVVNWIGRCLLRAFIAARDLLLRAIGRLSGHYFLADIFCRALRVHQLHGDVMERKAGVG